MEKKECHLLRHNHDGIAEIEIQISQVRLDFAVPNCGYSKFVALILVFTLWGMYETSYHETSDRSRHTQRRQSSFT